MSTRHIWWLTWITLDLSTALLAADTTFSGRVMAVKDDDGKQVTVLSKGKDRYGRVLGYVFLPDGKNLNYEIVGNGFGWWYEQYSKEEVRLKALEARAKEKRVGLWRDKNPVPPWRLQKRK